MERTERILIKRSDPNFRAVATICRHAKTVYNSACFLMRQSFFDGELVAWPAVDKRLKEGPFEISAYSAIPNAMSQAVIKRLGTDWKSYFAALAKWKKTPAKFLGKPRIPGYAQKAKAASMPFQHLKCVDGRIQFPKKTGITPIRVNCCKNQPLKAKGDEKIILEIRFVPHGSCYWLEVVYRQQTISDNKNKVLLDKTKHLSIDLGINNLATLVSDQPGFRPVLVNGKVIKSVNHLYNKDAAILRKKGHSKQLSDKGLLRFCWINDHLHKVSHFIIQQCLKNDIGTVVIGNNPGWKNSVNIGRMNNQRFVSIPHATLVEQILYKAEACGIDVIVREESYTSKASALDLDPVPNYDAEYKVKHRFSGRRVERGLYKAKSGLLLNADVNGALNILRKEIGDSFLKSVTDEGLVFRPRRITLQ